MTHKDGYPAHIKTRKQVMVVQLVDEHCRQTACYAQKDLDGVHLGQTAYLAGLLHDMGKCKEAFRRYIERAASGQSVKRGSVIHTFSGVRHMLRTFHAGAPAQENRMRWLTAELVAYAIGAHHGLFDLFSDVSDDAMRTHGFDHRLQKDAQTPSEAEVDAYYFDRVAARGELERLFNASVAEIECVCKTIQETSRTKERRAFCLALLARLLQSAVVDGDRSDTAVFMNNVPRPSYATPPWAAGLSHLHATLNAMQSGKTDPVNMARRTLSARCLEAAEASSPQGLYTLSLPTGSGKTLASLRFALAHAAKHDKKRILLVAPLLTIIEQNAAVVRKALGSSLDVLEHHSNVINDDETKEALSQRELLIDDWHAPVIVTTLVQFLRTLFSGSMSAVRRFQALSDSVIVLDEVQTVPTSLVNLVTVALSFLVHVAHATVVLSSATQPPLDLVPHPLGPATPLVPYDAKLWAPFQRTIIRHETTRSVNDINDLYAYARDTLNASHNLLVIVNLKKQARALYQAFAEDPSVLAFHLSAAMCPAHRRATLEALDTALKTSANVVCIATQVIEAGVDVSFHSVIRLVSGLDRIVQSAGRCNRHGESPTPRPVYVVHLRNEELGPLRHMQKEKTATLALLDRMKTQTSLDNGDLSSEEAVTAYYKKLYEDHKPGEMDGPIPKIKRTLFDLLACNNQGVNCEAPAYRAPYILKQAFKQAGEAFSVFDLDTKSVIVPYNDKAREVIAALQNPAVTNDEHAIRRWLHKARDVSVSIHENEHSRLKDEGALETLLVEGVEAVKPPWYDQTCGLIVTRDDQRVRQTTGLGPKGEASSD